MYESNPSRVIFNLSFNCAKYSKIIVLYEISARSLILLKFFKSFAEQEKNRLKIKINVKFQKYHRHIINEISRVTDEIHCNLTPENLSLLSFIHE